MFSKTRVESVFNLFFVVRQYIFPDLFHIFLRLSSSKSSGMRTCHHKIFVVDIIQYHHPASTMNYSHEFVRDTKLHNVIHFVFQTVILTRNVSLRNCIKLYVQGSSNACLCEFLLAILFWELYVISDCNFHVVLIEYVWKLALAVHPNVSQKYEELLNNSSSIIWDVTNKI